MKTIIIEDNPGAVNVLKTFLSEYPHGIQICGTASAIDVAKNMILEQRPELWLLDIRLQDKIIFSMLRELSEDVIKNASIVFLTAYYEPVYIHEALKVSAIDFIVKPVDKDQLFAVLDKARSNISKHDLLLRMNKLEAQIRQLDMQTINRKLPVYRVSGEIDYEDKHDIMYVETASNVTRVFFNGNRAVSTTRLLKFYDDILKDDTAFLRISKQVILNLEYLKSFNPKTETATLMDGKSLKVSRRKAAELMEVFSGGR